MGHTNTLMQSSYLRTNAFVSVNTPVKDVPGTIKEPKEELVLARQIVFKNHIM